MNWALCENNLFGLANFPSICTDEKWAREALKTKDYQLEAIKQGIIRNIFYKGGPNTKKGVYVGCPLSFATDLTTVRKFFPHVKLIVCIRDPRESFPSLTALFAALSNKSCMEIRPEMAMYYKIATRAYYEGPSKYEGDDNTYFHDFD